MNDQFGLNMQPGDFSEQVLVSGLGDLGWVAIGSQMEFDSGLVVGVVDRAWRGLG